jgi:hypothetical protein
MSPSDSRSGRATVMDSRPPWVRRHASVSDHPTGSLRFLDRSVGARRPLPPRRARPLRLLVAWRPVSGFTFSGRMATLTCVSRPKRVHARALRLTPSPPQASTARSPAPPLGRLHGERAIPMVSTFQLTRSTRLPDAPEDAATNSHLLNLSYPDRSEGCTPVAVLPLRASPGSPPAPVRIHAILQLSRPRSLCRIRGLYVTPDRM